MLLVQANRRLRAIFLFVKQPEKLPVILPIPTGIVDMDESFVFDLARDLVQASEKCRSTAAISAEAAFPLAIAARECG